MFWVCDSQKWLVSVRINLRKRLNLIDIGAEVTKELLPHLPSYLPGTTGAPPLTTMSGAAGGGARGGGGRKIGGKNGILEDAAAPFETNAAAQAVQTPNPHP